MRWLVITGMLLAMQLGCGMAVYHDDDSGDDDATGDDDASDDDTGDDDATGDDDTTGDDDDTPPHPLAPVLTGFQISHGMSDGACTVDIAWHAEDEDGDLPQPVVYVSFDGTVRQYNFQVGAEPPILSHDFALAIPAYTPGQLTLNTGELFDVELWMEDDAEHESNHVGEQGWQSPDGDCL